MNLESINANIEKSQEEILSALHLFSIAVQEQFEEVHQKFDTKFEEVDRKLEAHSKRFDEVLSGQDVILGRLENVEQEVTFWNPAITRNQRDIEKINKRLKLI